MARLIIAGLALAIWALTPAEMTAQEHGEEPAEQSQEQEHTTRGERPEGHGHHKNHIAVFAGATEPEEHHGEKDDPQFSLGLDYERRLTNVFGMGLLVDAVVEGEQEVLIAVPLFFHAGDFTLQAAGGYGRLLETEKDDFVYRFGVLYGFRAGKTTISPSVYYNVHPEGYAWLIGLTFGWGF